MFTSSCELIRWPKKAAKLVKMFSYQQTFEAGCWPHMQCPRLNFTLGFVSSILETDLPRQHTT